MKKKGTKGRAKAVSKKRARRPYDSCHSYGCGCDRSPCLNSNYPSRSCDREICMEESCCTRGFREEPSIFSCREEVTRRQPCKSRCCEDSTSLWGSRFSTNGTGDNKGVQMVIFLPWMFLLTMLFVTWSFYNIYVNLVIGSTNTLLWGTLIFLTAVYIGKKEVYSWRFYKGFSRDFVAPRNYSTLIFIILGFMLKGFWAYFYITEVETPCWMYVMDTLTSSLVTGFFFGRTMFFFKAYLKPKANDASCRRNIHITSV